MSGPSDISNFELLTLVSGLQDEVALLREENAKLRAENTRLQIRVDELEGKSPTQRLGDAYSLSIEEKRRKASSGKKRKKQKSERPRRIPTPEKTDNADRTEVVLPNGFSKDECEFVRKRHVRVINEMFQGPGGQRPQIEGGWLGVNSVWKFMWPTLF